MESAAPQTARAESKSKAAFQPWALLLVCVALLWLGVELAARVALPRMSKLEARIAQERGQAFSIGAGPLAKKTILIAGNSLPLAAIDVPQIERAFAGRRIVRYIVESTQYLDWYYGLRTLYASGNRPGTVVLSLNARHMIANATLGDEFGWRLMSTRDFFDAGLASGLSATGVSSLLLGNLSEFYGLRSQVRAVLLSRLLPGFANLKLLFEPVSNHRPLDIALAAAIAKNRLRQSNDLVKSNGGTFVFVVPATLDAADVATLVKAGEEAGVTVLVPLQTSAVSEQDFLADQFHLNPAGAARYTAALAPMLKQAVNAAR